mmetsp:Transcript_38671/g.37022  ORF Transcript_38671/g.37022 Transcript_38671/m.37022 type:complete len:328 (-) Transcript_38671:387-1370(-)
MQLPFEMQNLMGQTGASDTFLHLTKWVDHAFKVTNEQLLKILHHKYKLEGHFMSIRKYLLMGQGDFMQALMDLLAEELNNSASNIYKHTLMGYLETAKRSSNAQYHDMEFQSRLDIKLLEGSPGEKGWEIFMLDYRIKDMPDQAALQTIFPDDLMLDYLRIFNFLWRLKKVEHSLINSWRLNMENKLKFQRIKGFKDKFHKFNLVHYEMVHFISNIHNYIMVEVLESQWKVFQDELKNAGDLDQLIQCQRKFVSSILDKSLLSENKKDLYRTLMKLINNVYTFSVIKQKYFFQSALEEYDRISSHMGESHLEEESKDQQQVSQESIK